MVQTLIPILGQVLNASGDCMEAWCVPSATHVPWVDRSQNNVLGIRLLALTFMGPCIVIVLQYISNKMQHYTVYFMWKLLYMFRVVPPPIIRSINTCIYGIWYLPHRYCYLPLSWKSWNWFEWAVGGVLICTVRVHRPQHAQTSFNSSTIAAGSSNGVTNTWCRRYSCWRS